MTSDFDEISSDSETSVCEDESMDLDVDENVVEKSKA